MLTTSDEVEFWKDNGYVVIENAVSDKEIDKYVEFWNSHHTKDGQIVNKYGWDYFTCYKDYPEIRDILCSERAYSTINKICTPPCGIHLAFTYFYSRERSWHRDVAEENKEHADNYIALWIALEDIHPDSGVLQFIPGSHHWRIDANEAYKNDPSDPLGTIHFMQEIEKRNADYVNFAPKKGTAIIWQGNLVHRVDVPINKELSRKVVIAHMGSASRGMLENMPIKQHGPGWYFDLEEDEKIREKNFTYRSDK